ncbi:hypothetical protein HOF56_01260 [Candidatus Peribacteria bacterium]|jgi:hypothetical protein|nr:hypothetical protein [Candidatus Peribacteria bacterium]MBT4021205.1 hypothetical protein [Candidatus Peribacteria bacterium]MBT4240597.1 hypothetical protein [Candidatus Peribacteria bacterium]MBT4474668.1 hypothetical protein [Candidatus Peribacteria bacterium]
MSANTLKLRPNEKAIFDKLSDELKDGWQIEDEKLEAEETIEELKMRHDMFRGSETCKKILDAMSGVKDEEALKKAASEMDFSSLAQEDAAELFFTLGTTAISAIIFGALEAADSDDDLEGIASLTEIRHMLFESNSSI